VDVVTAVNAMDHMALSRWEEKRMNVPDISLISDIYSDLLDQADADLGPSVSVTLIRAGKHTGSHWA